MRIGIDIDGVLTNLQEYYMNHAIKFAYENNIDITVQPEKYEEVIKWSKEAEESFWKIYSRKYSENVLLRPFAKEVIQKLREERT